MSREHQPPLTRAEVNALLTHYRLVPTPVTDVHITRWLRELRGYSAGECHAALAAMAGHGAAPTAVEITGRIDAARTNPVRRPQDTPVPRPRRDRAAENNQAARAGARGIRLVYAAMGWKRHPDRDLALEVACRFCGARRRQVCAPLVRNRAGLREERDPASGMHPSRVADARAAQDSAVAR
ncbi:hypothetical protein [Alloactinosynnema sp. L-07]|uniref:zinc finger domain-containing protein n=1 Tax=Alloactinosynnema sp. L-07 TaxID=1653480 RepID=UPI00065EF128|nr:hypothetical protein [Alloactinosynnema sp. L-07]CRK55457.1 hypothetical protein [Alloactinosynnema sp. L-07]